MDHRETPPRRCRNAHLIAALTELVGRLAAEAGAVHASIATASPAQADVPVDALVELSRSARRWLDDACARDRAKWPLAAAQEEARKQALAAWCAEAKRLAGEVPGQRNAGDPSARESAEMALATAGADFLALMADDPSRAVEQAREWADAGEYTVRHVLDEATAEAVLAGLRALPAEEHASDPSMAVSACMQAVRHFALAVLVASVELEDAPARTWTTS